MRFVVLLFVYFLGLGSYLSSVSPYIVSHYGENAYRYFLASQLCYPFGYFLAGYLSDRTKRLRLLLLAGIALLAPSQFALFSFAEFPTLTLILSGLTRMLLAANLQILSIAVLEAIGQGPYARMRSAGTLGFACFQFVLWLLPEALAYAAGAPSDSNATAGYEVTAAFSGQLGGLTFVVCLPLALLIQSRRTSHEVYRFRDALTFSKRPQHLMLLALAFLFYSCFQLVDNYLGRFWELHTGGMRLVYGGWLLAVLLEVPFLYIAADLAKRTGIRTLIFLAAGAGCLRFAMLAAAIVGIEPVPVLLSQLLHGIHFTGYHIGMIYWLRATCPDHLYGSVYGMYNITAHSLGGMTGNVIFGTLLYSDWAARIFADYTGLSGPTTGFFLIFVLAAIVNAVVIGGFLILRAPGFRHDARPSGEPPPDATPQSPHSNVR